MKVVREFPNAASVSALLERDVTTVVIDTDRAEGTAWATAAGRLDRWPGVRLAAQSEGVRVYDITGAASAVSPSP